MENSSRLDPDRSRPLPVGRALAAIPESVYAAIDSGEPEWPLLQELVAAGDVGLLAGLALALSDFQLGAGGAARYWQEAGALLAGLELKAPADVRALMQRLMAKPVSSRLATLKLARVEKLLASGVPPLLRSRGLQELGRSPMPLWHELAVGMRQQPDAKTIAFAMKVFDLLHKITTGGYASFPANVPIVADLRIARVSLSSGLLRPAGGSVQDAMVQVTKNGGFDSATVRAVWASVAEHAPGVSLFRIDSLVWQVAEPVHRLRQQGDAAKEAVAQALRRYHAPEAVARDVGAEITVALR